MSTTDDPTHAPRQFIKSVERALSILFLLADSETTLSVGQIADRLGVHISTASRLLSTLAQQNVVMLTPNGYRLGLGVLRLAHIVLGELQIRDVAPALAAVVQRHRLHDLSGVAAQRR